MLEDFKPRPYQSKIFQTITQSNTLVVLPTGLGKTAIAMMIAARRLLLYPNKKILFVAPTKPLVEQQLDSFKKSLFLSDDSFTLFTGSVSPEKRKSLWKNSRCIFSTPQTIENDVLSGSVSLEDVSLLVVDEAHRATGDYAYVFLAKEYYNSNPSSKILALTASPGSDVDKINEVCKNLFIEKIEYRSLSSPDVKPFTNNVDVKWEEINLPLEHKKIISYLQNAHDNKLSKIKNFGYIKVAISNFSKTKLLMLQKELHSQITKGDKSIEILQSVSLLAEILKLTHALELAQTQTLFALHEYMYGILSSSRNTKTKAIKNLVRDPNFLSALSITRDLLKQNKEHPKLPILTRRVRAILDAKPESKIIIFSQFRDSALQIQKNLDFTSSEVFFGQAKKNGIGFSQKKQKEVLDKFRNSEFNVLIATSVAEEGLDIPSVDFVFFFEPIPSAIRSVQRRGRTGRHGEGFVTVLMTKNTRDEANKWVSIHREKRMYSVLEKLSKSFTGESSKSQSTLDSFEKQTSSTLKSNELGVLKNKKSDFKIIVDHREKGSRAVKSLLSMNVDIQLKQLDVGDFLLSPEVCVEFKNAKDFFDSIVDGRILSQLRSLSNYPKPLFVIEGDLDEGLSRNIDQNVFYGIISTIAVSYKIPIIQTRTPFETAKLFSTIAKREQTDSKTDFNFHMSKPSDEKSIQEYVISSFPTIGPSLAKALLEHFDSISEISLASVDDLKKVPLIGDKKAKEIYDLFRKSYKDSKKNLYDMPY